MLALFIFLDVKDEFCIEEVLSKCCRLLLPPRDMIFGWVSFKRDPSIYSYIFQVYCQSDVSSPNEIFNIKNALF